MRELARVFDIGEVFVVGDNGNGMWSILEILFPFRESEDDGEEFSIINIIIIFGRGESLGEVDTGMEVTICVFLHEDCSCGEKGGVRHDMESTRDIRDSEDWRSSKDSFKGIKRALVERGPNPRDVFTGESSERSNNI